MNPTPSLGHALKTGVDFAVSKNIHGQNPTVRQRQWFGLDPNLHLSEVVVWMLVNHLSATAGSDANDAVIEDYATPEASGVGDQQGHFDRPHASPDVAVALKLFEPIKADVGVGKSLAQTDVQSGVIQAGVLKNSDDFAGSSRVVESAIDGLIGLHDY